MKRNTIKDLPKHSRPREKLKKKGVGALTDQELVAAILGSGTKGVDVRTMAMKVANLINENKGLLIRSQMVEIPGMGPAKAAQILSAFELARRHLSKETAKICCAQDILPLITDIAAKQQEYFVCFSLNGANEVIERRVVTIGLLDQSQVHPREVFADVIADRAAAVILAHNHPSDDHQPSNADRQLHERLTAAAEILGLWILDHIIISRKGYFSFQEQGLLKA
ncbi:MAG TPA: DNA repair protein RadC [Patescibacteria group bacterium]|nr:DNA repair protein RadC [Patescibacteria group bacterium]